MKMKIKISIVNNRVIANNRDIDLIIKYVTVT